MSWILLNNFHIITIIMKSNYHITTSDNKKSEKTVYSVRSNGQDISVVEKGSVRSLYFGKRALQSSVDLRAPHKLQLQYPRYMTGTILFNRQPKSILILGIGGGSLISFFHHHFPRCRIDAVDHDPEIIRLAVQFFLSPQHANISYHCDDGLHFLQNLPSIPRYDIIFADGFSAKGMSAALYNRDCFATCRNLLVEDGTLVSNLWSSNAFFFQRVRHDLQESFPENIFIPVPRRGNHICYSRKQNDCWKKIEQSRKEVKELSEKFETDFGLIISLAGKNNLSGLGRFLYFLKSLSTALH